MSLEKMRCENCGSVKIIIKVGRETAIAECSQCGKLEAEFKKEAKKKGWLKGGKDSVKKTVAKSEREDKKKGKAIAPIILFFALLIAGMICLHHFKIINIPEQLDRIKNTIKVTITPREPPSAYITQDNSKIDNNNLVAGLQYNLTINPGDFLDLSFRAEIEGIGEIQLKQNTQNNLINGQIRSDLPVRQNPYVINVTINDGSRIKPLSFNIISPPRLPAASIRRGSSTIANNNLISGVQYDIVITPGDFRDASYRAEIVGIGSIQLNRENNLLIGRIKTDLPARQLPYELSITVNGDSTKIVPLKFNIIASIGNIKINNTWRGRPLEYAEMEFFRETVTVSSVLANNKYMDITRNGGELLSRGPNGESYVSTESNGVIDIKNVRHGERIVLAVSGSPNYDPEMTNELTWYTRTITVNIENPVQNLAWDIPSKGERRKFVASSEFLNGIDIYDKETYVWLYYKPGVRTTLTSGRDVIRDPGFIQTRIRARSADIVDDRVRAWVDLENVCVATQINYVLRIESLVENLIMDYITFEKSTRRALYKE